MTSAGLEGKVALVTGGARGIGAAISVAFAREGARVAVNYYRSGKPAREIASRIQRLGHKVLLVRADVSDSRQVKAMVRKVVHHFGRVDILVNNAGLMTKVNILETTERNWDRVVAINLKGTFLCSKAVAPLMVRRKGGRIINIASIAGIMGGTGRVVSAEYAASKAGILGLTKVTAKHLAPHVLVNAIAPGPVDTELIADIDEKRRALMREATAMQRFATPEEVARVAVFLASEDARFMTGQTLVVDGGRVMM